MTTGVRALLPTLLAAGALTGGAPSAPEEPPFVRTVRVKAVADEPFRDNEKWEKEVRAHFAWADKELSRIAGVGLQLVAVERWTTHQSDSMGLLLRELGQIEKGEADVVVGFTGHAPPEMTFIWEGERYDMSLPFVAGLALPLGDRAVVRRTFKADTRRTLAHEVLHLFGGVHVKEKSVLQSGTDSLSVALDPFNRRVLDATRGRAFDRSPRDYSRPELDRLVALYREAPLRHERDPDTNIRLAYLFLAADQAEAAVEEFKKAMAVNPRDTVSLVRESVIPELETYLERNAAASSEVRLSLGVAYNAVRDWSNASRTLTPSCYARPPHAPSCAHLGGTLIQMKRFPDAERALVNALSADESNADAHGDLALVFFLTGRMPLAIKHFNRALELRPDEARLHFNMGLAYLSVDLPEPAAGAFRRALELEPGNDPARAKLALTHARQGELVQARELIREFEKRRQLPATVVADMAEIYFRGGDKKQAWEYLDFAKKGGLNVTGLEQEMMAGSVKPRAVKTEVLLEQARAYYDTRRYDLARRLLEQARAQDPGKAEVCSLLGYVARAQDNLVEAEELWRETVRLEPGHADAHLRLARLAFDRRDYAAALPGLRRYLEVARYPAAEAYYLLGRIHLDQNEPALAEENLKKAIRAKADYGDAFYQLGRVYQQQGRDQEAIAELKLAVDSRSLWGALSPDAHCRLTQLFLKTGRYDEAWKHGRIAKRLGSADVDPLLGELARIAPEPTASPPK
jgi:tetratricopeptide (TPR) repeat protein